MPPNLKLLWLVSNIAKASVCVQFQQLFDTLAEKQDFVYCLVRVLLASFLGFVLSSKTWNMSFCGTTYWTSIEKITWWYP